MLAVYSEVREYMLNPLAAIRLSEVSDVNAVFQSESFSVSLSKSGTTLCVKRTSSAISWKQIEAIVMRVLSGKIS